MDGKKTGAVLIIAIVIVSASLILLNPVPEEELTVEDEDAEIVLHPFNRLDWWDIAWNLSQPNHFDDAINLLQVYGPRVVTTPGHDQAVEYFQDQLEMAGIPTSFWGNHETLVGYQEGYGTDNRAIVFGAHIDTWDRLTAYASTGINQNGAGCSVVLMIARTLAQFRLPIDVYYCFYEDGHDVVYDTISWTPELYNMWGSNQVAQIFVDDNADIIAAFNFDDLLWVDLRYPDATRYNVEYRGGMNSQSKYVADVLTSFMQPVDDNLMTPIYRRSTESDHQSFWDRNFTAVNVMTAHHGPTVFYVPPSEDLLENPNYEIETVPLVARAAAAAALYLGLQGNGEPTVFRLDRDIGAETTSSIYTAISDAQIIDVYGTVQGDHELVVEIGNEATPYITHQISGNFSFPVEVTQHGPLVATVYNAYNETVRVEMYLEYETDVDGDGIYDSEQYSWPDPDPILDWDHDSLKDVDEVIAGTDIFDFDTDDDSISDGVEVRAGINPLRNDIDEDYDADEITNIMEIYYGTDPLNNDSDADTMTDTWEIRFHTNPLIDDTATDYDGDGLTTLEEYYFGSDPLSKDGDFDGLSDLEEYALGTNPLDEDSDSDGLRDNLEVLEGLDPLGVDYDFDLGFDGADANPRINIIIVMISLIMIPVMLGLIYFRKRLGT
ncbi:MAG: M28 family peptidase [Candidatus Thorarchaeota archaeon]